MRGFILLCFILATIFACKSKPINLNTYDQEVITIGSGGGFTGVSTTYYITPTGEVFRNGLSDTSYISVGKLDAKVVDQQFKSYNKMGLDKVSHNDPGNRYYFLSVGKKGKTTPIQWGGGEELNQVLPVFHRNIMELIKSLEPQQ